MPPATAGFRRRYTEADVLLLAEVDTPHGTLSGPATRVLLERALRLYGDERFTRLAQISVAHLYNLRKRAAYQKTRRNWTKTRPTPVLIGVRKPPRPRAGPASSALTRCTRATKTGSRVSTTQRRGLRDPLATHGHL